MSSTSIDADAHRLSVLTVKREYRPDVSCAQSNSKRPWCQGSRQRYRGKATDVEGYIRSWMPDA